MAGLVPGSRDRVWTALWVPVIILAHAFSAYWLIKAFLTTRPAFFKQMRQRIRTCLCCEAGATPEDAGCDTDGHPPAGEPKPWVTSQQSAQQAVSLLQGHNRSCEGSLVHREVLL